MDRYYYEQTASNAKPATLGFRALCYGGLSPRTCGMGDCHLGDPAEARSLQAVLVSVSSSPPPACRGHFDGWPTMDGPRRQALWLVQA